MNRGIAIDMCNLVFRQGTLLEFHNVLVSKPDLCVNLSLCISLDRLTCRWIKVEEQKQYYLTDDNL